MSNSKIDKVRDMIKAIDDAEKAGTEEHLKALSVAVKEILENWAQDLEGNLLTYS